MSIKSDIEKIKLAEDRLHKQIDDEINLSTEITEVSNFTAKRLTAKQLAPMSIQGRDFLTSVGTYVNDKNKTCIQVVAREKTAIDIGQAKIYRAEVEIDTQYTMEENLVSCIKAMLGHITGLLKPEVLD